MTREIKIGDRYVGDGHPVYIVAEIGINHNGDLNIVKRLVQAAKDAGCDAVKFQKRTPEACVPLAQRDRMRETPWGYIGYMEYRKKIEFGKAEFDEIDRGCKELDITWFASSWDKSSLEFIDGYNPPCHKIPSAMLTNTSLLKHFRDTGRPLVLSTGMSMMEEIRRAVAILGTDNLVLLHCTSSYPCPLEDLNLRMITTLREVFPCPIGYSGHEVGLPSTVATVPLGVCMIERHITLDRAMWGSDQSASVEPGGLVRLVRYIRVVELALGDGVKRVTSTEKEMIQRLRPLSDV